MRTALQTDKASHAPRSHRTGRTGPGLVSGFTLIEMLVVLGIIAGVLTIALPNLRMQEGQEMESAARQLIADLNQARARAVNHRTTVAMVFIPPEILTMKVAGMSQQEAEQVRRLQGGVFTMYALFSSRQVGDQPGHSTPRYLTEWKALPEKTFIAEEKFSAYTDTGLPQFDYAKFPFPLDTSPLLVRLPYLAFDYEGRLCNADGQPLGVGQDARIPLARGAILYSRDASGAVTGFTAQEVPKDGSKNNPNHVVIDWLTGRARFERAEIQAVP